MARRASRSRKPVGRPAGQETTRAAILVAARKAFASTGYEGTSLRAIGTEADVDPSTVIHFFGSKEDLFKAVIDEARPAIQPVAEALAGGVSGRELATIYLSAWEDPESGSAILALFRAALASEQAIGILQSALPGQALDALPAGDRLNAQLVVAHLLGIAIGRYVAKLPGLAGATVDEIAERVGPVLDAYRPNTGRARASSLAR